MKHEGIWDFLPRILHFKAPDFEPMMLDDCSIINPFIKKNVLSEQTNTAVRERCWNEIEVLRNIGGQVTLVMCVFSSSTDHPVVWERHNRGTPRTNCMEISLKHPWFQIDLDLENLQTWNTFHDNETWKREIETQLHNIGVEFIMMMGFVANELLNDEEFRLNFLASSNFSYS